MEPAGSPHAPLAQQLFHTGRLGPPLLSCPGGCGGDPGALRKPSPHSAQTVIPAGSGPSGRRPSCLPPPPALRGHRPPLGSQPLPSAEQMPPQGLGVTGVQPHSEQHPTSPSHSPTGSDDSGSALSCPPRASLQPPRRATPAASPPSPGLWGAPSPHSRCSAPPPAAGPPRSRATPPSPTSPQRALPIEVPESWVSAPRLRKRRNEAVVF